MLSDVIPVDGVTSEEELLRLASCLEEHFPHPVSRAIVRQAQERGVIHENEVHDTEVRYIVAHGICSSVAGRKCFLGSRHFVQDDEGIDISPAKDAIARLSSEGKSILYLAVGDQLAGVLRSRETAEENGEGKGHKLGDEQSQQQPCAVQT